MKTLCVFCRKNITQNTLQTSAKPISKKPCCKICHNLWVLPEKFRNLIKNKKLKKMNQKEIRNKSINEILTIINDVKNNRNPLNQLIPEEHIMGLVEQHNSAVQELKQQNK